MGSKCCNATSGDCGSLNRRLAPRHLDANQFFTGRKVERDVVRGANNAARVITGEQPDVQGVSVHGRPERRHEYRRVTQECVRHRLRRIREERQGSQRSRLSSGESAEHELAETSEPAPGAGQPAPREHRAQPRRDPHCRISGRCQARPRKPTSRRKKEQPQWRQRQPPRPRQPSTSTGSPPIRRRQPEPALPRQAKDATQTVVPITTPACQPPLSRQ
jgi:hypothetical protein